MAYELMIEDVRLWEKDCSVIPRNKLRVIFQKIGALATDPWPENAHVRQLKHYALADFRLRVGDYRVLFNKDDEEKKIHLLRVLDRSKLY